MVNSQLEPSQWTENPNEKRMPTVAWKLENILFIAKEAIYVKQLQILPNLGRGFPK